MGMLVHIWWECKMVQLLWKHCGGSSEIKHRITIWSSNAASRYIESRFLHRHTCVH